MRCILIAACAVGAASPPPSSSPSSWRAPSVGGDPSSGWLTYAQYRAPQSSVLTNVSMSWNVPGAHGNPTAGGSNAPGWWYGVQTHSGDGALVQPIVACDYEGSSCRDGTYKLWGGVYDWTKPMSGMTNSKMVSSKAGDEVFSYTACSKAECTMFVRNERTKKTASMKYKLPTSRGTESVLYIVLEHAPSTCAAFPPDGVTAFRGIVVHVDGKRVTPKWECVKGGSADCGSKCTIVDDSTVAITWNGGKPPAPGPPPAPRYHCDPASGRCAEAGSGHATMAKCQAACAAPAPPPPPAAQPYACVVDAGARACRAVPLGTPGAYPSLAACQQDCS